MITDDSIKTAIYDAIARALPTLGKDFSVDISVANRQAHVVFKAHTPMGRALVPHLRASLQEYFKHVGRSTKPAEAGESAGRNQTGNDGHVDPKLDG